MDGARDQRSRRVCRASVLVLALLQLAAVVLAPLAEATARARSLVGTLHVEAADAQDRGAHHDHVTCQFCRVASLAGPAAPGGSWRPPARSVDDGAGATPADLAPATLRVSGGGGSRAPPLA